MKHVNETLNQYKDFKFFSLLEEKEMEKEAFPKDEKDKVDKKPNNNDAQKNLDEKQAAEAAKDAQDILKKIKDNFTRFKSYAGTQIEEYKNFWNMQTKACEAVSLKDQSCEGCYALFNDGSDKFNPQYLICLRNVEGKPSLTVIKTHLEENEENPTFIVSDDNANTEFKSFLEEVKNDLKNIKNNYIKTVETKKKEEEHKIKREKLNKFLKESKK